MSNTTREKFVSATEAGAMLGVTARTVRIMVADGRLNGYRLGRTIRLRLSDVEAAMKPIPAASA